MRHWAERACDTRPHLRSVLAPGSSCTPQLLRTPVLTHLHVRRATPHVVAALLATLTTLMRGACVRLTTAFVRRSFGAKQLLPNHSCYTALLRLDAAAFIYSW